MGLRELSPGLGRVSPEDSIDQLAEHLIEGIEPQVDQLVDDRLLEVLFVLGVKEQDRLAVVEVDLDVARLAPFPCDHAKVDVPVCEAQDRLPARERHARLVMRDRHRIASLRSATSPPSSAI